MKPATLDSANKIPMLNTLGIRLAEIGDNYAIMKVTVDERHANYFGGAHGGLLATLVDTVSFFPQPLLPCSCHCCQGSSRSWCPCKEEHS